MARLQRGTASMRRRAWAAVAAAGVIAVACGSSEPATTTTAGEDLAHLQIISTDVTVQGDASGTPAPGTSGQGLGVGSTVATDAAGFAEVGFFDGSLTRVDHGASFTIVDLQDPDASKVVHTQLTAGRSWNRIEKLSESQTWELDTPVADATVRGTAFVADSAIDTPDACRFSTVEGVVELRLPDATTITLDAGQEIVIVKDTPPPAATTRGVAALLADEWVARNVALDQDGGKPDIEQAAGSPIDGTWTLTAVENDCAFDQDVLDGETMTVDGSRVTLTNQYGAFEGTVSQNTTNFTMSLDQVRSGPPVTSDAGVPLPPAHFDFTVTFSGGRLTGEGQYSAVAGSGGSGYSCLRSFTAMPASDDPVTPTTPTTTPTTPTSTSTGPCTHDAVEPAVRAASARFADPEFIIGEPKCDGAWAVVSVGNQDFEVSATLKWDGTAWGPPPEGFCTSGELPQSLYIMSCASN